MAKAKGKNITMEDALVPVAEQPYEVPENWCWTKLGALINLHRGVSYKKNDAHDVKEDGDCLILRGGNIGEGYIDVEVDNVYVSKELVEDHQLVRENDIVIVGSTGSTKVIGRAGISLQDYNDVAFGAFLMLARPIGEVNAKYIGHLFQSDIYRNRIRTLASGVNINNIKADYINETAVPLPPLPEQQRIVEQIESLFSKLDEAMEKAQEALDSFEERRVAILHKAFEGELTLQWRAEHGVDMSSWRDVPLKDCGRWFGGGTPTTSKKEYWEGGDIPWITSKDMKDRIIEDSLMHITMTGVENSSANYCEEPAVLFVMRSGILRRVFPVCMVKRPFTVNQDLKACVPDGILQEYLYWYCTGFEKDIRDNCMKSGTTVESVEAKKLFDYSIRVAGADEQKEIVNRIEAMLDKEAAAYEAAEEVIENIEVVKKSILAKAFRGELGTNDSSEESSIELLKQIIANE